MVPAAPAAISKDARSCSDSPSASTSNRIVMSDRDVARGAIEAALEIADGPRAQLRALRQLLLTQAGAGPVALGQFRKSRRVRHREVFPAYLGSVSLIIGNHWPGYHARRLLVGRGRTSEAVTCRKVVAAHGRIRASSIPCFLSQENRKCRVVQEQAL